MTKRSVRRSAPEYKIWSTMIQRCTNKNDKKYCSYGARGIKVCDRWRKYDDFLADIGKKPSADHSIDRIDNDGDYEPENCKWSTRKEQQNNMRTNHIISFKGESLTVTQWAERIGLKSNTLLYRIRRGWTTERALSEHKL